MNHEIIGDQRFGIVVYKTDLKQDISTSLENYLSFSTHNYFRWNPATVGYFATPNPDYRKCMDCKIGEQHLGNMPIPLERVYIRVSKTLKQCVYDYTKKQNIHQMEYMEAINFVRYETGEHFAPHNDHGYTYVSTISTVTYFNDEYSGGELFFSKLGITIKPMPGDVVVFPSNYIYTHASLPVESGTKYAAVTMFDYTDKWHKFHAAKPPNSAGNIATKDVQQDVLCGGFEIKVHDSN
jgi:2OG-Fe(II) oxygenase superfamily